uniref:thioesterase domain-containing protein n=1 Tax=Ensifer aridi TaxID=1708715 RepID=UPI001FCCE8A8
IAARLCEHALVGEAAVVARQDAAGDKRLVAYVVCRPELEADEADGAELAAALRAHLGGLLPDYMVPAAFVRLDVLPLTPNGKLDRKALPVPDDDAYARRAYEAPQGAIETLLAAIWEELLDVKRVGRHDNFFELGGHSLLAVQLLSQALHLGLKFSTADIFQAPVLKDLASKVDLEVQANKLGALCVRAKGLQPPLFFVPTGLGDCSYVAKLVMDMNVDCPVYALPWPFLDEGGAPALEKIAAEVILAIKEIQRQGPYRLAGYSSGAILAYAIAERLLSLHQAVSFMGFIDVTLPVNQSDAQSPQVAREAVQEALEAVDDETLQVDASMYERIVRFQRAVQSYQIPHLPIEIHQFYASEPVVSRCARAEKNAKGQEASSPMRGWEQIIGAARVHATPIPGGHMTMMSVPENRRVLARWLSTALNRSPTKPAIASNQAR